MPLPPPSSTPAPAAPPTPVRRTATAPLAFAEGRNHGARLREFSQRGQRCVALENARVRWVVAADKGADIVECLYKPADVECLWHSRLGLRDDAHLRPSSPLPGGHFREHFPGGWYTMLPNGPQPCRHRGAEFGHHGEATLLPWDYRVLRDDADGVEVAFHTRLVRIPLRIERRMAVDADGGTLRIVERVENESGQRVEFLWGHHPTFGWPLLAPGTRILLPGGVTASTGDAPPPGSRLAASVSAPWPRLPAVAGEGEIDLSVLPPTGAPCHDFVRLDGFDDGWFALHNPGSGVGFALRWEVATFPMAGLWLVWGGGPDHPWYGMPHLLAIEPASDLPSLAESVRRGTALALDGGGSRETVLEATVFAQDHAPVSVGPGGKLA